jgi:hypothetical protein
LQARRDEISVAATRVVGSGALLLLLLPLRSGGEERRREPEDA